MTASINDEAYIAVEEEEMIPPVRWEMCRYVVRLLWLHA